MAEYRLTTPLNDEDVSKLKAGDIVYLSGVLYTARDAAQRDYRTFVVKDATADIEVIRHERALINLEFGFAHLISVADATAKWGND